MMLSGFVDPAFQEKHTVSNKLERSATRGPSATPSAQPDLPAEFLQVAWQQALVALHVKAQCDLVALHVNAQCELICTIL